jgi:hypothetical protein
MQKQETGLGNKIKRTLESVNGLVEFFRCGKTPNVFVEGLVSHFKTLKEVSVVRKYGNTLKLFFARD